MKRALARYAWMLTLLISALLSQSAERPAEIRLWSGDAPGSAGRNEPERVVTSKSGELSVSSVHRPSLTPYLPDASKANGCAVLVIPGGGHRVLAITHEGYNVAQWLQEHGIAAFVLKHRLARETNSTYRIEVEALADTQRAFRTIQSRAKEWHIDPSRVGVMGFSAGGELAWQCSQKADGALPNATDPVDAFPAKPAFQALIYPGRSDAIQPSVGVAPAFLCAGYGDRKDIAEGLAEVYLRFKRVGVPAELHMYSEAGHGFGYRPGSPAPHMAWMDRFYEWLQARKQLQASN